MAVRKFDEVRTKSSRAVQIWQILIGLAHNRQTITYGMLGDLIGFKGVGIIGPFLDPIMKYCKKNELPPLTLLIVEKYVGVPGGGLATVSNPDIDRESVFDFNWYNIYIKEEDF